MQALISAMLGEAEPSWAAIKRVRTAVIFMVAVWSGVVVGALRALAVL